MSVHDALGNLREMVYSRPREEAFKPLMVHSELFHRAEIELNDILKAAERISWCNPDLPLPNYFAFGTWVVLDRNAEAQ